MARVSTIPNSEAILNFLVSRIVNPESTLSTINSFSFLIEKKVESRGKNHLVVSISISASPRSLDNSISFGTFKDIYVETLELRAGPYVLIARPSPGGMIHPGCLPFVLILIIPGTFPQLNTLKSYTRSLLPFIKTVCPSISKTGN